MPQRCCVPMCNTSGGHRFPRDPVRKKQWLKAICRDSLCPDSARVCRSHFLPEDYIGNYLESRYSYLKKDAVPSVFVWSSNKIFEDKKEGWRKEKVIYRKKGAKPHPQRNSEVSKDNMNNINEEDWKKSETKDVENKSESITDQAEIITGDLNFDANKDDDQISECRACLQQLRVDQLYSLFQGWAPSWLALGSTIAEDLSNISNIQLSKSDIHSKFICHTCCDKLWNACQFKMLVEGNDRILRQRISDDSEKVWPKPIQVEKGINSVYENIMPFNVDIKQEVLSDEEAGNMDDGYTDGPLMEIKIEPEEIMEQPQIMVNGVRSLKEFPSEDFSTTLLNGETKTDDEISASRRKRIRDIFNACKKEDNNFNEEKSIQSTQNYNNKSNTNIRTTELVAKREADDSLIIIPAITDEEQNFAKQPISNNTFEVPDSLVDCLPKETSATAYNTTENLLIPPSLENLVPTSPKIFEESLSNHNKKIITDQEEIKKEIVVSSHNTKYLVGVDFTVKDRNIPNSNENDITTDIRCEHEELIAPSTSKSQNFEDPDFIPLDLQTPLVDKSDNTGQRPKTGQKRKIEDQNRDIIKKKTNNNEDYVIAREKAELSKVFAGNNFHCQCPKKCTEQLSADKRRAEFDKFWKAGSYEARCALLQGYVKELRMRSYSVHSSSSFTRKYYIHNVEICKKAFLNTLGISQARMDSFIMKNQNNESINDKRGAQSGNKNKIRAAQITEFRSYIESFPKYISHYCRKNTSNYLASNLNLSILYRNYKEKSNDPLSFSSFRQYFLYDYNLKFKKPQKDTCLRCDTFKAYMTGASSEQKTLLKKECQEHLHKAYSFRHQMEADLALAKSDRFTETLTFDVEKTHSLPKLPTSIVYDKRQLNIYYMGIHCGSIGKGYFYVWLEHEAGRGTQEVGSCLRKYIQENLKSGVTHLILWSNPCGGQVRNIKMVLILLHILQNHSTLEKITLRFMQSGHAYLPNDSEFRDVESVLKIHLRLYTADDFIEVVKNCRSKYKFEATKLAKDDFFSIESIQNQITSGKCDIQRQEISWLDTFQIKLVKNEPTILHMKSNLTGDVKNIDIGKGGKGRKKQINFGTALPLLYPEGRELSTEKIKDLKDMLKLLPPDAKPFYNFLNTARNGTFIDEVNGFGSKIDFEIEEFTRESK